MTNEQIIASLKRRVREFELRAEAHRRAAVQARTLLDAADDFGDDEDGAFMDQMRAIVAHHEREARDMVEQSGLFDASLRSFEQSV